MVRKVEGIFIYWWGLGSDEPVKQLLRYLNQTHNFIIRDLGEGQLFIKNEFKGFVRDELEKFLDQQTFKKPEQF